MNISTATPVEIDTKIAELYEQVWKQRDLAEGKLETVHYAVGDRKEGRYQIWRESDQHVLSTLKQMLALTPDPMRFIQHGGTDKMIKIITIIEKAQAEESRLTDEINELEAKHRENPWSRFHQLVVGDDPRIHDSRYCHALSRSNPANIGWRPELSGKSVEQAVAELGPYLCTKCFPKAKPEHKLDPKDFKPKDPNACPGAEELPVEGTRKYVPAWNGGGDWAKCTGCGDRKQVRADGKVARHKKPKGK